jgi:hypothetical protein
MVKCADVMCTHHIVRTNKVIGVDKVHRDWLTNHVQRNVRGWMTIVSENIEVVDTTTLHNSMAPTPEGFLWFEMHNQEMRYSLSPDAKPLCVMDLGGAMIRRIRRMPRKSGFLQGELTKQELGTAMADAMGKLFGGNDEADEDVESPGGAKIAWESAMNISEDDQQNMTEEETQRVEERGVQEVFAELDNSESGLLDQTEIKAVLSMLGLDRTSEALLASMGMEDPHAQMDFEGFYEWWREGDSTQQLLAERVTSHSRTERLENAIELELWHEPRRSYIFQCQPGPVGAKECARWMDVFNAAKGETPGDEPLVDNQFSTAALIVDVWLTLRRVFINMRNACVERIQHGSQARTPRSPRSPRKPRKVSREEELAEDTSNIQWQNPLEHTETAAE